MNRIPLLVVLFATHLSLASSVALAQPEDPADCAARILVYIDISTSVKSGSHGKRDAYNRLLDAFDDLLKSPGFLTDGDEISFIPFGETLLPQITGNGRSEIEANLEHLRNDPTASEKTNIISVLKDIALRLSNNSTTAHRTLVIVASDFAHYTGRTNLPAVEAWRAAKQQASIDINSIFNSEGKNYFLLLRVDPPAREAPLAQPVLDDLLHRPNLVEMNISTSLTSGRVIAKEIQKSLLDPLLIKGRFVGQANDSLEVTVLNPNCRAVTLKSLRMGCVTRGSSPDLVSLLDPGDQPQLTQSKKNIWQGSLHKLGCPYDAKTFKVVAETVKGLETPKTFTKETFLEAQPMNQVPASHEPCFFRDTLRLYINLRGQILESKEWNLSVQRSGSKVDLIRGHFQAPRNLDPNSWSTYLFILPSMYQGMLSGEETVSVSMSKGTENLMKGVWPLHLAEREATLNQAFLVIGVFTIVLFLFLVFYQVFGEPLFARRSQSIMVTSVVIASLGLAYWGQFAFPDENIDFGALDYLQIALINLFGLGWSVFLLTRLFFRRRLGNVVRTWRKKPQSVDQMKSDLRRVGALHGRNRTAITIGSCTALLAVCICLFVIFVMRSDAETPLPPNDVAGTIWVYRD